MSVLAQAFLTLVRSHFMSLMLLSVRHNILILKVFLADLGDESLGGLESGHLWAGITMVVFFEMLRAVFFARVFTVKLPKPRRYTFSPFANEFFTLSMKLSTTLCTLIFSTPVLFAISFTISAFVMILVDLYTVNCFFWGGKIIVNFLIFKN